MTKKKSVSVERFAVSFQEFLSYMEESAGQAKKRASAPLLSERIAAFLELPVHELAIARSSLLLRDLPNIQLACQELFATDGWHAELLGYTVEHDMDFGMAKVLMPREWDPVRAAPAVYNTVDLATGPLRCLERGLYLVTGPRMKAALLTHAHRSRYDAYLHMECAAATPEEAQSFIARIEHEAGAKDVLRGSVLSLSDNAEDVKFHRLSPVLREELILPDEVRTAIERTTIGFSEHGRQLLKAGRHVKRGLLLHGPPGTGKSHTLRYLIGAMTGRTTVVLTGRTLGLIRPSCELARALAPATVVLEDVDLVAEDRTREPSCGPFLFELMNEMDGLPGDADIIFLLTTNRPDILEPALASRPGRIDQAIEFPLPDESCRCQLFDLYGRGLDLDSDAVDDMIGRTDGASPAFIRELIRRAALNSSIRDGASERLRVSGEDMGRALDELLVVGGALTGKLLGVGAKMGSATR